MGEQEQQQEQKEFNDGGKRKLEAFELAKQRAQEIASRIANDADQKRPRLVSDNSSEPSLTSKSVSVSSSFSVPFSAQPSLYHGSQGMSKKITIPNGKVGVVIGRGGETIKYIQVQSGAKIQITKDQDADPHSLTRDVELMGSSDQISRAEELINDVIAETDAGSSASSAVHGLDTKQTGGEQFMMKVPNDKVGLLIGKSGDTIKYMQNRSGARMQDSYLRLDVGEASIAEIPINILDPNNPVGAIISPSHLDFLRHLELGRQNYKSLLVALAERWWDTTNTFHFPWGEMTMTPTDFSVISGIPFGTRPIELYGDWRTEVTPDRMMELIGIDLPRIVRPSSSAPDLSISRHWLSLQAYDVYARHRQGELTATQVARFTLLLLFASTFWSNRKEKFNPSILKSLEDLAHLTEYDWAGAILSRMYDDMCDLSRGHCKLSGTYYFWETWAFEYFSYIRPELTHANLGLGLVPLAWRWYRANHRSVLRKKSLGDLRAFFDTCTMEQVEVGAMNARLQNLIEADPSFRRSEALSRRRIVLSHPVLRRYYLGERVNFQIRGCRSVPHPPPEDMRAGKQMILTDAHTEGISHMEFIRSGDYDEFCQMFLMQPIGSRLDNLPRSTPSQLLGTRSSRASGPSARTPRRRPATRPSTSTPVEGPSRAGPSHSASAFRVPRAISEATGPIHPGLANLHLPYSIPYCTPDGISSLREVSLENVNPLALPPEDITEVPVGLISQMMELILGMREELTSVWTLRACYDQRRRRPRH